MLFVSCVSVMIEMILGHSAGYRSEKFDTGTKTDT